MKRGGSPGRRVIAEISSLSTRSSGAFLPVRVGGAHSHAYRSDQRPVTESQPVPDLLASARRRRAVEAGASTPARRRDLPRPRRRSRDRHNHRVPPDLRGDRRPRGPGPDPGRGDRSRGGQAVVILDGTLVRIDRVAMASGRGRPYYSGKWKCTASMSRSSATRPGGRSGPYPRCRGHGTRIDRVGMSSGRDRP
jgi:hypothetical protein